MSKKMMLLALSAISAAMLVVPAVASALPAHLNANPGAFQVHGFNSELSRVAGGGSHGTTTTGSGSFENTTTGTITLKFHGVTSGGLPCNSTGEPSGTVATTKLPFHLVMLATNKPGILITPLNGHFATYLCGGFVQVIVKGNGVLGEITSPACGVAQNTATVKFNGAAGVQTPSEYTGVKYGLESSVAGSAYSPSAMNATATIQFGPGVNPSIVCTH